MFPPIWIVDRKLSFQDIIGKESAYADAWATIVDHWIFEPARHLAQGSKVIDRGMALLTLELAFFEPFGAILTGEGSVGASQRTFSIGLKRFAEWLATQHLIGDEELYILSIIGTNSAPNLVYSFARCGLMHSGTMQGGRIFVDALNSGEYSITDFKFPIPSRAKDGSIAPANTIILFDPWRLLPQLQMFVEDFRTELCRSDTKDSLYKNFKKTFEQTFVEPGKIYLGLLSAQQD